MLLTLRGGSSSTYILLRTVAFRDVLPSSGTSLLLLKMLNWFKIRRAFSAAGTDGSRKMKDTCTGACTEG